MGSRHLADDLDFETSDNDVDDPDFRIDDESDTEAEMEVEVEQESTHSETEEEDGEQGISVQDLQRILEGNSSLEQETSLAALLRTLGQSANDGQRIRRFARPPTRSFRYKPSENSVAEGAALLATGDFGRRSHRQRLRHRRRPLDCLRCRESIPLREDMNKGLVPNSAGSIVAQYGDNAYAGQFSADSSFYYTCIQDFNLYVYDTTAPVSSTPHVYTNTGRDHTTSMKLNKTIRGFSDGWTITDSHLSPDNEWLAYACMSNTVYMAKPNDVNETQVSLVFEQRSRNRTYSHWGSLAIWSCRFSADGKELVAGGSGRVLVYDLVGNRTSVSIEAHDDDVNSVCWADTSSGNILVSASDDSFLKVWDRRSLGSSSGPSGVLIGHTEGITYVSPKGDGRYVISNGKDQTLKLWDLRMMASEARYKRAARQDFGSPGFDYRHGEYSGPRVEKHPDDCSVMTYHGHSVLRTLIRCHFSPTETTGGRYIYSGSSDGLIHIWSLDGTVVQVIDRSQVQPFLTDPSAPEPEMQSIRYPPRHHAANVVRDVSWHSEQPVLMSCAWGSGDRWSGYRGTKSTVARHEWKGLSKMRGNLEDWIEKKRATPFPSGTPIPEHWEDE